MGTYLVLLLESAICLALFYLLYKLALSKDTFHRFNRVVLLSMLLLSVVIPAGAILLENAFRPMEPMTIVVNDVQLVGFVPTKAPSTPFPLTLALIVSVYAIGVVFFSGRLLRNMLAMSSLMRKSKTEKLEGRIRLFTHQLPLAPFSWMRNVVVSSKDLSENRDIILAHELAHIRFGHSWDLLITDLCILLQWFNPAAWLIRQELQTVHEFEADDKVLQKGFDAKKYQLLIIEKAVGSRLYSLANSLNHGSLKKRITMMLKEKSNPWARAKYAVVLPLAAIALVGFARPEFTTLQARSAGEFDQLLSWSDATEPAGPTLKPSQSPSPNQSPQDKSSGNSEKSATTDEKKSNDSNPLVVLDDVAVDPSVFAGFNFKTATDDDFAKALNIGPSDIKQISVWKGEAVVSRFGANGRNGVILIITNKSSDKPAPAVNNLPVEGIVVNADDNTPVANANITERNKDSRILTMTKSGSDGRFSLIVKQSDNPLIISHLSFNTAKALVNKNMTVYMTKKKIMLAETVVKGYQKVESTPSTELQKMESEMMVEMMPQYPGGDAALLNYIRNNMRYPAIAVDKGIQGKVVCSFVIDANGKVSDIKVMQGVDPSLDAEAIRVISGMPNWIPGRQNGVNCAVQYALPIQFSLEQYSITAKKK